MFPKCRLHLMNDQVCGWGGAAMQTPLLAIPPNFFAITMGLAGLAGVWRLAGDLYHLPAWIGDALYVVTAGVFLLLIVAFAMKLVLTPKAVMAELTHTVLGPFYSLLPMGGMRLGLGLEPYAYRVVRVALRVFFISCARRWGLVIVEL